MMKIFKFSGVLTIWFAVGAAFPRTDVSREKNVTKTAYKDLAVVPFSGPCIKDDMRIL